MLLSTIQTFLIYKSCILLYLATHYSAGKLNYTKLQGFLFLLCMSLQQGVAQLPVISFRYLNLSDGLPEYTEPHDLIADHYGRLWFATDKGLYCYDGFEVTNFPPNVQDSTALSELTVLSLYMHVDSTIWIGTSNMGICIYHPEKGHFSRVFPIEDGGTFPARRVRSFNRDQDGTLWIGCDDGLVRCEPDRMEFKFYQYLDEEFTKTDFEYINTLRAIEVDPRDHNKLWICTRSGLVSFDKTTESFTHHIMPYSSLEVGLMDRNYMLINLEWTSEVDMWCTSWAGGIMHFNTETKKWQRFRNPYADPLYDIGFGFLKKNESEFWFATYDGAGTFNYKDQTYSFFKRENEQHGGLMQSAVYNPLLITHDRILVIGSSTGLNFSNEPVDDFLDKKIIKPIITAIMLDHRPYASDKSENEIEEIYIEAGESTLSFTCSWPIYRDAASAGFRFKLEGYDKEWNISGNSRKVQYTNLSPGKYRFVYEASSDGNEWVRGYSSPVVIVNRPFYKSSLFVGGFIVFLLGTIILVYTMRIRQIQRESRLKTEFNKRLAENEMTALRAQMNPHFMFNSLNSIKNYILKENTNDASKYLTKFSQLMRAILKNSRHKLISLSDELYALKLYIEMESMRFNSEFEYEIFVDDSLDTAHLFIPPLLIQPYVENAIWHGLMMKDGPRFLQLRIVPDRGRLMICIEDNGVGRLVAGKMKPSENGPNKSYGMTITKDRIELINSTLGINAEVNIDDLRDDHGSAIGTRVIIHIPVLNEEVITASLET